MFISSNNKSFFTTRLYWTVSILLISFLLTISFTGCAAQMDASKVYARLEPAKQTLSAGQTFNVDLMIFPGSKKISAGEFVIGFDPQSLTAVGVTAGSLLGAEPLAGIERIDNETGQIEYSLARRGSTSEAERGVLASVQFTIKEDAPKGACQLTLSRVSLADAGFREIAGVVLQNAEISIR